MVDGHTKRCWSLIPRKVQIKALMKYHLTPSRVTVSRKTTNNQCWRGCGKRAKSPVTAMGWGHFCPRGERSCPLTFLPSWISIWMKQLQARNFLPLFLPPNSSQVFTFSFWPASDLYYNSFSTEHQLREMTHVFKANEMHPLGSKTSRLFKSGLQHLLLIVWLRY